MTYREKNFTGISLPAVDGDVFIDCNMSQMEVSTVISTAQNLTFRGCNLTRCVIDPTWTLIDCNANNFPDTSRAEAEGEANMQEILL